MFFLSGLCNRSSLSFLLVTAVRLVSIVSCILGLSAELFILIQGVKGVQAASHAPALQPSHSPAHVDASQASTNQCGYIGYTDVPKSFGGVVFFTIAQLFGFLLLVLCLVIEIAPPKSPAFFDYIFPPLGQQFGVGFVGALEVFVACEIMSHYVSIFPTVAAWFLLVLGILNILLGAIMGPRIRMKRSIFEAGKAMARDALPIEDIEKGVHVGHKGFDLGRKAWQSTKSAKKQGKNVAVSAPMQQADGPVMYNGHPIRGPFETAAR